MSAQDLHHNVMVCAKRICPYSETIRWTKKITVSDETLKKYKEKCAVTPLYARVDPQEEEGDETFYIMKHYNKLEVYVECIRNIVDDDGKRIKDMKRTYFMQVGTMNKTTEQITLYAPVFTQAKTPSKVRLSDIYLCTIADLCK